MQIVAKTPIFHVKWASISPEYLNLSQKVWTVLKHVFISEMEIIIDVGRCRRWSGIEKLRTLKETLFEEVNISDLCVAMACIYSALSLAQADVGRG